LSDRSFRDEGRSAFRGKHALTGHLSHFLVELEAGSLEKGAVLILEDFDRLTRQTMLAGLDLVRKIVEGGIDVFCTLNWRLYTKSSLEEPMALMEMLWRFYLAHEESNKKAVRSRANWKTKHEMALTRIMSKICPGWLAVEEDKGSVKKFVLIPERVHVVRQMFQWCIDGRGMRSIVRELCEGSIPSWRSGTGWNQKYVYEILTDRRVLGELPSKTYGDKVEKGGVIANYYPRIIDEATYEKAVNAIKSRKGKTGRRGDFMNLFTGRLYYPGQDSTMVMLSKPKSGGKFTYRYLASLKGWKGLKPYVAIRYERFERAILLGLHEIRPSDFSNDPTEDNRRYEELMFLEDRIKELSDTLSEVGVPVAAVVKKLAELETRKSRAMAEQEESRKKAVAPDNIKDMRTIIQMLATDNSREFRAKVRQRLAILIERIDVRIEEDTVEVGTMNDGGTGTKVFCLIRFRDGHTKGVWYDTQNIGLFTLDGTFSGDDLDHFTRHICGVTVLDG
jgi:hypothetical protein